jgi:hypothetical protein
MPRPSVQAWHDVAAHTPRQRALMPSALAVLVAALLAAHVQVGCHAGTRVTLPDQGSRGSGRGAGVALCRVRLRVAAALPATGAPRGCLAGGDRGRPPTFPGRPSWRALPLRQGCPWKHADSDRLAQACPAPTVRLRWPAPGRPRGQTCTTGDQAQPNPAGRPVSVFLCAFAIVAFAVVVHAVRTGELPSMIA